MKELSQQTSLKEETGLRRFLCLFIGEKEYEYAGEWVWDLRSEAVFCSDVMGAFPAHFDGTAGLIHPDDKALVMERMAVQDSKEISFLQFRIITTYGEVKTLTGRNLQSSDVTVLIDPVQQQERVKADAEALGQAQRLVWRRRSGELAERLTATGTWYLDTETHELYYSDEVFRIYGLPRQSLNAHINTFNSFIHPDDRDTVTDAIVKAIKERVPLHLEHRIFMATGEERILHQAIQWEYNERGGCMLYGMVQDITEQIALGQNEQTTQHDLLFKNKILQMNEQSAGIGHWSMNLLTRKVFYSDNMYRLHGLKPGSVPVGSNVFLNFVHPEDRDVAQEVYKKIVHQHTPPDIDFRIVRGDGKLRYMRQRGKLMVYGESEMVMVITLQDISSEVIAAQKSGDLKQQVALRQAAQRQAEEMAGMGSWFWELQTDKITWSESLYELLGQKPSATELSQKHLTRAIHPEDRKRFADELRLTTDEKRESKFEFRILRNGEIRQVCASFRLVDYSGKDLFIGVLENITRDKQLEQEFAVQAQQAASISENMLDRIVITDIENTVQSWNKRCEEIYGLKREAVIGRNIFDVFPLLKNETDLGLFNRALNGETILIPHSKALIRHEYHDLHMIPLKNNEGHVTGILHLLHDVTKERETEQRLSNRLNFIENLLEVSVDRIIVMDRYMNYLYCNGKAAAYLALRKEDIIGKNVLELFPASVNDPTNDHFRKALKGETVHIPAIEGFVNEHYYEVFLIPIKDEDNTVSAVLWIHHDLSGEIKMQRQLKKSADILNTINAAFIELDEEFRFKYLNPSAEQHFGKPGEALLGNVIWEAFPQLIGTDGHRLILKTASEHKKSEAEYFSAISGKWQLASFVPSTDGGVLILFYNRQEIKEAEQNLQQEHRRLKEAQHIGKIGSFEWNIGAEEVAWSDEMYRINGLEPGSEVITIQRTEGFIYPDDYGYLKKLKETSFVTPGVYQLTHRIMLDDGTVKWVNHYFETEADKSGAVVRVHGAVQDITGRIEAEQELKDKVQFIQSITTATTDILYLMHIDTKEILYTNRPVANVLGYTKKQVEKMKHPLYDVIYSHDKPAVVQHCEAMKTAKDGEVREIEYRVLNAAGDIKWCKDRNAVFERDSAGIPLSKFGISEDITERKQREEELFKNLNLLKQSEEVAGMGTWEYKMGDENMTWSEGMYQLFGLKQGAKVKPETYLEYIVKDDRPQAKAFVKEVYKGAGTLDKMLTIETGGVRKILKVKGVTVKDSEGKPMHMLGVDLDITELMHAESMLKALNRSLDQRNKELEAKNEELANFSFIASHDLREPLRKIHTFSDWLLQREAGNLSDNGRNYLRRMSASVERMNLLIEDVLVLTKLHSSAFGETDVDLNAVLRTVKSELAETIRLTKTTITADALPVVVGNKDQVQQLFKNLISNGIKFQHEGSTPQLTIKSAVATADEIVTKGLNIEKEYVKICFTDNGIGMDEKYDQKIFQIFQRLHARMEYDGTGIGLAICKKVMENHRGAITVKSVLSKGAAFCCYFPV